MINKFNKNNSKNNLKNKLVHNLHVDGVVQDRNNPCTLAKESLQSHTKPSLYQQVYTK